MQAVARVGPEGTSAGGSPPACLALLRGAEGKAAGSFRQATGETVQEQQTEEGMSCELQCPPTPAAGRDSVLAAAASKSDVLTSVF